MKQVFIDSYCKEERETHFWHDEVSNIWCCETSERIWNTKLQRAGWNLKEEGRNDKNQWVYSVYEAPSFALSVRSATKSKRAMTDEQKQMLSERLSLARSKKN